MIGGREADTEQWAMAEAVGQGLSGLGLTVLCGGPSIGILPDSDLAEANPYVGVPLATGIGVARNAIIARAAFALIAAGGGRGTLPEIAFGLRDAPALEGVIAMTDWRQGEPALCRPVLAQ